MNLVHFCNDLSLINVKNVVISGETDDSREHNTCMGEFECNVCRKETEFDRQCGKHTRRKHNGFVLSQKEINAWILFVWIDL